MNLPTRLARTLMTSLLACGLWASAQADSTIHHGPTLDIQVQRGEQRLSIFQVNRLQSGDKVRVRPESGSLAKGDWVLLLGRISPAGNQVETRAFDLTQLNDFAELDIDAPDQAPVIVLAPQLRNLFGLYTSFTESRLLLEQVLQSDPQRFYDLQKVDQVNQAITALSQGLDQRVLNRNPEQAVAAAKAMAAQFGVRQIDPDCFKGNAVNTGCVAINIVANKNFVLPSSSDLGMLVGAKGAKDLTSFLTDKLGIFSDAADFLTNKFRDQYDFAATFGRPKGNTQQTELFSLARFRSGSIKTAYVYVPAWFKHPAPTLSVPPHLVGCHAHGQVSVQVQGNLPVVNYWHGWEMAITDPANGDLLARHQNVSFQPDRGLFRFEPETASWGHAPAGSRVSVQLSGQFGFDPVKLPPFTLALPPTGDLMPLVQGAGSLVSGDTGQLRIASDSAACIESMTLRRDTTVLGTSTPEQPSPLSVNLSRTTPGSASLHIERAGAPAQDLTLRILPPRAKVSSVTHAELDEHITATGEQLERLASLRIGGMTCTPGPLQPLTDGPDKLRMNCPPEARHNARLPEHVMLHHQGDEPAPMQVPLQKSAAAPRLQLAPSANALLIRPSAKAQQWGLGPQETLFSDDSGLHLLLRAVEGYTLSKGTYSLQLRFADDPTTARQPITEPLMADPAHQELRTRNPVRFKGIELPSVVNPLEYRVVHQPSGLNGAWTPLNRSVLMLPELTQTSCTPQPARLWVHGSQLDLIDTARLIAPDTPANAPLDDAVLEPCSDGLCLALPATPDARQLAVKLRWVNQRIFNVNLGRVPSCKPE